MSRADETVWEVFARKEYAEPLHHVRETAFARRRSPVEQPSTLAQVAAQPPEGPECCAGLGGSGGIVDEPPLHVSQQLVVALLEPTQVVLRLGIGPHEMRPRLPQKLEQVGLRHGATLSPRRSW